MGYIIHCELSSHMYPNMVMLQSIFQANNHHNYSEYTFYLYKLSYYFFQYVN